MIALELTLPPANTRLPAVCVNEVKNRLPTCARTVPALLKSQGELMSVEPLPKDFLNVPPLFTLIAALPPKALTRSASVWMSNVPRSEDRRVGKAPMLPSPVQVAVEYAPMVSD